jgi:hypothetical protein
VRRRLSYAETLRAIREEQVAELQFFSEAGQLELEGPCLVVFKDGSTAQAFIPQNDFRWVGGCMVIGGSGLLRDGACAGEHEGGFVHDATGKLHALPGVSRACSTATCAPSPPLTPPHTLLSHTHAHERARTHAHPPLLCRMVYAMETHGVTGSRLPPIPTERQLAPPRPLSKDMQGFLTGAVPYLLIGLVYLAVQYVASLKGG